MSLDSIPRDEELWAEIVEQVKFYFSNENILKDAFLLKHVRRNKEGFVSLKLVTSFKRIRQITKDWRVVSIAIKEHTEKQNIGIELNELGSKVRRTEAIPLFDETVASRTIIAFDLPLTKLSIENVSELFAECGEISLIRILRPGGTVPTDIRQYFNKFPELNERECALIEFTESAGARIAHNIKNIQSYHIAMINGKKGKNKLAKSVLSFDNVESILINNKMPYMKDMERNRGGIIMKSRRGSLCSDIKHEQKIISTENINRRNSYGNIPNFSKTLTDNRFEQFNRCFSHCYIGSDNEIKRKINNMSDEYCFNPRSRRNSNICQEYKPRSSQGSRFTEENNHRRNSTSTPRFTDPCSRQTLDNKITDMFNGCMHHTHGRFTLKNRSNSFDYFTGSLVGCKCNLNIGLNNNLLTIGDLQSDENQKFPALENNIISNKKKIPVAFESSIRTPNGPDGSKGFNMRTRKLSYDPAHVYTSY